MSGISQFEENAVCEVCGRFGAFDFGGKHLCVDCYEAQGSCCPEFAGYDLCEAEERPVQKEEQKVGKRAKQ